MYFASKLLLLVNYLGHYMPYQSERRRGYFVLTVSVLVPGNSDTDTFHHWGAEAVSGGYLGSHARNDRKGTTDIGYGAITLSV